jgi:hypothetical protein
MTSLRWLPGRSLAGHIITRPSAELGKMNGRMLRDNGLRPEQAAVARRGVDTIIR